MHICIEGPNGAGKTTIVKELREKGFSTLSSPNGTDLAKYIRSACRGADQWDDLSDMVKFLLFSAARCDEFDKLIKDQNTTVICDRWHLSTWVYQCQLGNIPVELYEMTIHPDEHIDLVIILTGDPDTLINRVEAERSKNPNHGKCTWTKERETMIRIGEIYVKELPQYLKGKGISFRIVNTTDKTLQQVRQEVEAIIKNLS